MAEYEKKIRKILSDNMCYFIRHGKGDHDIWYCPVSQHSIVVPVKIKSRHTANSILKEAGINYKF